jgi:molybdate transport system regulatory protein
VIEAQTGGIDGGGATLTPLGRKLVQRYHAIEVQALAATRKHLHDLEGALKSTKKPGLHNSIRGPMGSAAGSR